MKPTIKNWLLAFAVASFATSTCAYAALSSGDQEFLKKVAIGGMTEVKLGELAAKKGESDVVKEFGEMMVKDHSKANEKLLALAKEKGIELPTELDAKHKKTVEKLSNLSGSAFDKKYVAEMVDDHEKDVKEFEKVSKNANDPDVKKFAETVLPVLKKHLERIKEIEAGM